MSGADYIYTGAAILAVDVILFVVFQVAIKHHIKSFKEIWKKLD